MKCILRAFAPVLFLILINTEMLAQADNGLPYFEIPEHSENYHAGSVASRMVDGLGFRYYWATDGLRQEDLLYKPSELGRTAEHTIDHIYDLSHFILISISGGEEISKMNLQTFAEKRKQTLLNFQKASAILRNSEDLSEFDNEKFPFWNIINGPISDALWHCGQIVMMRRASGNPFNSKVSVFQGKLRE